MERLERVQTVKGQAFLFAVETSHEHEDYQKYENLRFEVWEEPDDRMPGNRNMVCENYFNDGSALFLGVFVPGRDGRFSRDGAHLVGFSYGFVGVKDKKVGFREPSNLVFYSQYTAVREGWHRHGLGLRIKKFQRDVLTRIFGITLVSCTFDPLTGVNAFRNLHRLGMTVSEYRVAHYGQFGGRLNRRDIPCDRFYALWDLSSPPRTAGIDLTSTDLDSGLILGGEPRLIEGKSGPLWLESPGEVRMPRDADILLIEIPGDFYTMLRETDVADEATRRLPLEWRLRTRQAFQDCLASGLSIIDFQSIEMGGDRKRSFYLLERSGKPID